MSSNKKDKKKDKKKEKDKDKKKEKDKKKDKGKDKVKDKSKSKGNKDKNKESGTPAKSPSPAPREDGETQVDDRTVVDFAIRVVAGRGLCSRKGPDVRPNSLITMNFGLEDGVVTSSTIDDTKDPEYEFVRVYHQTVDEGLLQMLVEEPLKFSVYEVEKKSKTLMGTVTLPWDDFLRGEKQKNFWLPFDAPEDGEAEADKRPGEINLWIAFSDKLLSTEQWEESKIITIFMDGLYSTPPRWIDGDVANSPFGFEIRADIPVNGNADDDRTLVFEDGQLTEPSTAALPSAVDDLALQRYLMAERSRPGVKWDTAYRCYFGPEAMARWRKHAVDKTPWILHLRRGVHSRFDPRSVDPDEEKYRGIVHVDLAGMLNPGATSVTARAAVIPEGENTQHDEKKRGDKTARKMERNKSVGQLGKTKTKGKGKEKEKDKKTSKKKKDLKEDKKDKKDTKGKKGKAGKKKGEKITIDPEAEDDEEEEGGAHPYVSASTFVTVTLELDRPIYPKPPTPKPVYRVKDFLPPRERLPRPPKPTLSAKDEFKSEVSSVTAMILEEYKRMYAEEMLAGGSTTQEERKKKFLEELRKGGSYFAFKEQLKQSVLRIVREKFEKSTPINAGAEMPTFFHDLYMYLIDHMNETVDRDFADVQEVPIPKAVDDVDTLKRYAEEAEILRDFPLAARHYQDRVARERNNVDHWFDYACFCLRANDVHKADECLREAINLNDQHVPAVLTYGLLLVGQEQFDQAGMFLTAAARSSEQDSEMLDERAEAWAILSLLYDMMEQDVEEEEASERAELLERQYLEVVPEGQYLPLYVRVAQRLLQLHLFPMAERALARDLLAVGERSVDSAICFGDMTASIAELAEAEASASANYTKAEAVLREVAMDTNASTQQRVRAWVRLAHILYVSGKVEVDSSEVPPYQLAYESALELSEGAAQQTVDLKDLLAVYLRLGGLYILSAEYRRAKDMYLRACRLAPSSHTWLGVGASAYRLEEFDDAESALSEANILNNLDPDVWAYLTLVSLRQGREGEANQAMTQVLKLDIQHPEILAEIGVCYGRVGQLVDAEHCLLHSLRILDDVHTRRLLADVLLEMRHFENAKKHLLEVADEASGAHAEDRQHAFSCLADVSTAQGHTAKAKEYRALADALEAQLEEEEEEPEEEGEGEEPEDSEG